MAKVSFLKMTTYRSRQIIKEKYNELAYDDSAFLVSVQSS